MECGLDVALSLAKTDATSGQVRDWAAAATGEMSATETAIYLKICANELAPFSCFDDFGLLPLLWLKVTHKNGVKHFSNLRLSKITFGASDLSTTRSHCCKS